MLEKSLDILNKIDIPYDIAKTHLEFGLMYKKRGDMAKAAIHLKNSSDIFKKLGASLEIDQVSSALLDIEEK